MRYLGKENEIKVAVSRPIEYVRCDKCNVKILPREPRLSSGQYVHIHTWHHDWDNDSVESHEHHDYCIKCAKEVVAEYIENMTGTEELELENKYLVKDSAYRGSPKISLYDGYALVEDDTQ